MEHVPVKRPIYLQGWVVCYFRLRFNCIKCHQVDDVKNRRELQEVTTKLVEMTTEIASRYPQLSKHFEYLVDDFIRKICPQMNNLIHSC